jgi:hypothetical protein
MFWKKIFAPDSLDKKLECYWLIFYPSLSAFARGDTFNTFLKISDLAENGLIVANTLTDSDEEYCCNKLFVTDGYSHVPGKPFLA